MKSIKELTLRYLDFEKADEILSTGNFAKVAPVIRIDDRQLQPAASTRGRGSSIGISRIP
jgi:branched-subunit amino acid aminotransferase/4-amino-4-deoxychorismate lyase